MSTILQRRRGNNPQDANIEIGECDEELPLHLNGSPVKIPSPLVSVSPSNQQQRRRRRSIRKRTLQERLFSLTLTFLAFLVVAYLSVLVVPYPHRPPRLPVANVDVHVPNENDWPLIHIVNTRFMQEQGPLETLGMARFHLFMTFCFPTIVAQSTQKFFWIIKTDPKFTTTPVFELLLQAANTVPHKNVYVVASNRNFLQHPEQAGNWVDGAECMDLLQSKIYTGNVTKLRMAMALRNERPVLETRLDADDGLHMHYLKYIQMVALQRFKPSPTDFAELGAAAKGGDSDRRDTVAEVKGDANGDRDEGGVSSEDASDAEGEDEAPGIYVSSSGVPPPPRWLYWCTRRHLEWHNELEDSQVIEGYGDASAGFLAPIQHDKLCVTPGISVGFNVGVDAATVPIHSHDELVKKVGGSDACYDSDTIANANRDKKELLPCLDLVEELVFCALRSRTFTSAGMRNVGHVPPFQYNKKLTEKFWLLLKERFSISRTKAKATKDFLHLHQKDIAYENILGQCTSGHSCKDEAKKELERLINIDNTALGTK